MKKIGILGLGISGQSILKFLSSQKSFLGDIFKIRVMDLKYPDQNIFDFMKKNSIEFCLQEDISILNFFENNDYIVPSPGINLNNYYKYQYKIVSELDIFYKNWHKKIIAITGSVGKTTVTHLIGQILKNAGLNVCVAGNIGLPMLDIISCQDSIDYAILEVSSFQLEFCKYFSPDIAIWTNLFENHLDRHVTIENYFNAKFHVLKYQKANQIAILNSDLKNNFKNMHLAQQVYWLDSNYSSILDLSNLPDITFRSNWLIILSLCNILKIDLDLCLNNLNIPDHRLQLVANINSVNFYNDSKSTVPQSTIAAIEQLSSKSIYLLLGGLSKGVDREPFIKNLKNKVKFVACFGKESQDLDEKCKRYLIPSQKFSNLDDAFSYCVLNAKSEEQVLLSPAGSSYDLFKDYQARGNHFLSLVYAWRKKNDQKVSD